MLSYAALFLIIALIAAIFGFGGIAAGAAGNSSSSILDLPNCICRESPHGMGSQLMAVVVDANCG